MNGVELAIAAVPGIVSHDLLTNYINGSGETYRTVLANILTPVFKDPLTAEIVATVAPALMIPLFLMAIRISRKELVRVLFNKRDENELNPQERAALMAEIDERQMYDAPADKRISRRDISGVHVDPVETKMSGLKGQELRTESGGGSGTKGLRLGKTVRSTPSHGHGKDGTHLPS